MFSRLAGLLPYVVVVLFLVLSVSRLLGGPVGLVVVAGRSMEPALRMGDVALVVRVGEPGLGDVVVWCTGPTSCVVHRVVGFVDGYVVTRGDANPAPDPPVPRELVQYRVVFVLPRELVVGVLAVVVGYRVWRAWPRLRGAEVPVESVALAVVGVYVVVVLVTPIVAPQPGPASLDLGVLVPRVSLVRAGLEPDGSVVLVYNVSRTGLVDVLSCSVHGGGVVANCTTLLRDTVVYVDVPTVFYERLYSAGDSYFRLSLVVELVYGVLDATYTLHVAWRPLSVKVYNCSLRVWNPNPAPINVSVVVEYANLTRPGLYSRSRVVVEAVVGQLSSWSYVLGAADVIRVVVEYPLPGGGVDRRVLNVRGCGG